MGYSLGTGPPFGKYGNLDTPESSGLAGLIRTVQAMEDVRFCAIQERNYMLLKAVCDSDGPEMFEAYRQRYR